MTVGRMDIVIPGAGPYGFRLAGGDGRPLTVTKVICFYLPSSPFIFIHILLISCDSMAYNDYSFTFTRTCKCLQ